MFRIHIYMYNSKQGHKWKNNKHFQSPSITKEGMTYHLNEIVNYMSNGKPYIGKLTEFYLKVDRVDKTYFVSKTVKELLVYCTISKSYIFCICFRFMKTRLKSMQILNICIMKSITSIVFALTSI